MENLTSKAISLYAEYKEFETIVKKKNSDIANKSDNLKDLVVGKTPEELQDILTHVYVDTILYNKDLQIMFFKLITTVEMALEFSKVELPEEVMKFYNEMKTWAPKKVFMIEKGDIVESEKGNLNSARKEFIESDFFKELLKKTNV
jgi:DNA-directed RNA polymerase beta' subunit